MAKLSDYPFTPHLENEAWKLVGIHKCRAFRDPDMRRMVFEQMCRLAGEKAEIDEVRKDVYEPNLPSDCEDR